MILILLSIKILAKQDDFILSSLSKMIVNRDLLKISLQVKSSNRGITTFKRAFRIRK
jgi:hypothetical protein